MACNKNWPAALLLLLSVWGGSRAMAQDSTRKGSLLPLPIAFYTPETRFGFGAAAVYAFRFHNQPDSSKASQVQLGFAYTQNKQILSYMPWRLYWKDSQYLSYGEIGYYRYNYFFYGIGNGQDPNYSELFDLSFPRIRLNFLRKISPNHYVGLRYWLDAMDITGVEPGGQLASGMVPGSSGSVTSGIGITNSYDTRDQVFTPTRGKFLEAALVFNYRATGSEFSYTRLTADYSMYFSLPWEHVVATNAFADLVFGEAPFTQLAQLGGTQKMRGYYLGRFRDDKLWLLQAEYRMPLFWRLGLVAFGSWGMVAEEFDDFAMRWSRLTYGGGLRFKLLKKEGLNMRVDYGYGKGGGGFYITVGEAF